MSFQEVTARQEDDGSFTGTFAQDGRTVAEFRGFPTFSQALLAASHAQWEARGRPVPPPAATPRRSAPSPRQRLYGRY